MSDGSAKNQGKSSTKSVGKNNLAVDTIVRKRKHANHPLQQMKLNFQNDCVNCSTRKLRLEPADEMTIPGPKTGLIGCLITNHSALVANLH